MTTATLKGFANGTATVSVLAAKVTTQLGQVDIVDNTGTLEIDTTSTKFVIRKDANEIIAVDADGNLQDVSGKFTIKPEITLDPTETEVSKDVEVELSDWTASGTPAVTIGGDPVTATAVPGKKNTYKFNVPSSIKRGTQTVKVTVGKGDSMESATASLTIGVLSLTVSPDMAVPGQTITIQGTGFVKDDVITEVTVDGIATAVLETGGVKVDTNKSFIATAKVPSPSTNKLGDGTKTVSVTTTKDGSGRVAEGKIEVPKASIKLSPEVSRRGTTVTVTGSGFPASSLVQVAYKEGGSAIAAATTDATGEISIDFVVPGSAGIGSKSTVEAKSISDTYAQRKATATHETPGAMIELSATELQAGDELTVTGMNFPALQGVSQVSIGTVQVLRTPYPITTSDGDFTATVTVPGIDVGNYTLKVTAGNQVITKTVTIVPTAVVVSTDPADVFATLIEAEVLDRVFHYDNATQKWTLYDPDPAFAEFNDLTSVSSGDIVWVKLTAAAEFQGQSHEQAGWILVSIQ